MVQAWLAADPDPDDRRELARLRAEVGTDPTALDRLRGCFRTPLRFGTAGLRGPLREYATGVHAASQFSWTCRFRIPDSGHQR
ncbi:hypothetical protein [Candidatus Frankia nodulisporulans]|uniref:hypothetical protein n=1 Tax=Candidatus Frankia nodulisporulans TaxID=2060052 RepID=UPI0013D53556|nr:hypothetical protein [Candidatus Frankia nodulisporulans]